MIPVLSVQGQNIAEAWEMSLIELHKKGCDLATQYDKEGNPPSKDATMIITVVDPLSEPMIHRDMPGGFEDLQEYTMEVLHGIKDHCVRDANDKDDTYWEYTYHQRLFAYDVPTYYPDSDTFRAIRLAALRANRADQVRKPIGNLNQSFDQIEEMCQKIAKVPHTRRAQAITWKVWEDNDCDDPACLQSIWCRVLDNELAMNVRFRSNDAYKAAFMNIFAIVQLQKMIAARISELSGEEIKVGRYCHIADSYHLYGSYLKEFNGRFMGAMDKRTFEQRTMRYEDVKDIMDDAIPGILEKAAKMGRSK